MVASNWCYDCGCSRDLSGRAHAMMTLEIGGENGPALSTSSHNSSSPMQAPATSCMTAVPLLEQWGSVPTSSESESGPEVSSVVLPGTVRCPASEALAAECPRLPLLPCVELAIRALASPAHQPESEQSMWSCWQLFLDSVLPPMCALQSVVTMLSSRAPSYQVCMRS